VPMQSVTWKLTEHGHEMIHFTVSMFPEGDNKTRVKTDFEITEAGDSTEVAQAMNELPIVKAVASIAMSEQVHATLEHRPYDKQKIGMAIATYAAMHPGELREYTETMKGIEGSARDASRAEEALSERRSSDYESRYDEKGNRKDGYIPPVNVGGSGPMMSTEPMTDLSRYDER
jgi:hypothetical protein